MPSHIPHSILWGDMGPKTGKDVLSRRLAYQQTIHYLCPQIHHVMVRRETYWTTITDCNGAVEQELSYDAWGNLRDPDTWTGETANQLMLDRGYTGHEHLPYFGLINMNGRVYDPVVSSFLSVDAFVDEPTSAQGFNRYAYCMYNPLKYVDPSGWQKVGGMRPRNEFHDDWSNSHVQPVYEPSDFRNAYYLVNQALYGEDVMGGCGYGEAFQAGMEFYQGASPGSVWSLSHLINNYDNYPSVLNRRDLIEAGVCDYTYSTWWSAEGQGGYQFNISLNHGNYYYENNNYYYGNKGYADVTIGGLDLSRVSNVINVAGLYTTIEGALHFSKPLGIFMDKRGEIRHFIGQPNKNLRKKMNYGKTMNNRFTTAGRVLGGVGVVLSVIQFNQYESDEEKIMCAFDIMIGSAGVVAPQYFGAFSTFWFLGGRQISKWYGEKVITPMIEEGVNPGLMIYQPFK